MTVGLLPLELEDPKLIGGYRLRGRLGEGGMGVVYLAGSLGDHVAIKTMRAADLEDPEARGRFVTEARLARNLDCPYTPRVIHDGSEQDFPYVVTDYIEGPSLGTAVQREGALPEKLVMAVALGVADALAQIHAAGIAHRDIKPGNILLAEDGPRVIDFGIAQEPGDAAPGLTRTGLVMGSPGWVAPERLAGGRASFASDVFCWGMLVAYAATGRHPFGGSVGMPHMTERILNLAPDLTDLEPPLRTLVSSALDKDPLARPDAPTILRTLTAEDRATAAQEPIAELWPAAGLPPSPPDGRSAGRDRRTELTVAAVVVGALALALTLGAVLQPRANSASPTRAPGLTTTPGPTVTVTAPPASPPVPAMAEPAPGEPRLPELTGPDHEGTGTGKAKGKKHKNKPNNGKEGHLGLSQSRPPYRAAPGHAPRGVVGRRPHQADSLLREARTWTPPATDADRETEPWAW
ncbi:serine/threonine-protein kinase [Actinocorallia longicatena]|uniref:Protein kinase domain-containing protein n=1 Tax=Actinocorallia longicatena TaxID=111803 RepID=A0ABP6Q611_9ACTN